MKSELNKNKPEICFSGDYIKLHNIICLQSTVCNLRNIQNYTHQIYT